VSLVDASNNSDPAIEFLKIRGPGTIRTPAAINSLPCRAVGSALGFTSHWPGSSPRSAQGVFGSRNTHETGRTSPLQQACFCIGSIWRLEVICDIPLYQKQIPAFRDISPVATSQDGEAIEVREIPDE
jgi:hypothetical protein